MLVTGANGFLGKYLLKALLRENHEVVALVRAAGAVTELQALSCKVVRGDVTDKQSLRQAFAGVEAVFHLASQVSVFSSDRAQLYKTNVEGTRNVLELCRENSVGRLVHVSSVVAVGASSDAEGIMNENSVNSTRAFQFPNCESKSVGEELVLQACRRGEVDAVVVNPSMVFGAGDAVKPPRKGNILAAQGKLAWYTRGGLSAVGAEDVVAGMIAALKRGRKAERYILSGENLTMKQVLGLYAECAGARPPRHEMPSWLLRMLGRIVDALRLRIPLSWEGAVAATSFHWFDHSKAAKELGFNPRPAREAIQGSVDWMRSQGYLG